MALRESAADIEAAGGRVVAVMQGTAAQAQALCDQYRVQFPCLGDPDLSTYKAFDIKRGSMAEVAGPATWAAGARALSRGHFGGLPIGDVMQLPGTFIVDRGGIVRYAKYARHSGDHPKTADLIAALRELDSAPAR